VKNPREFSKIHNDVERKVFAKKRTCAYPGCMKPAIGSHNISEAVLNIIAHKGHVRKFKVVPYQGLDLPSIGVKKATRFTGFCSAHDSDLFKPVDQAGADPENERNILLLNYRANVQEELLKTYRTEFYSDVLNVFGSPEMHPFSFYQHRIQQIQMNKAVTQWYTQRLLSCIDGYSKEFVFKKIQIPFFEVAASELFGLEPTFVTEIKRKVFDVHGFLQPFATLFVHIMPDTNREYTTVVLSAHQKDEKVLNWFVEHLKSQGELKLLSDLLLLYLELWCCSEEFYQNYVHLRKKDINKLFVLTANQNAIERETEICLFDSLQNVKVK
jgi:hypothetical protein